MNFRTLRSKLTAKPGPSQDDVVSSKAHPTKSDPAVATPYRPYFDGEPAMLPPREVCMEIFQRSSQENIIRPVERAYLRATQKKLNRLQRQIREHSLERIRQSARQARVRLAQGCGTASDATLLAVSKGDRWNQSFAYRKALKRERQS